jgi:ubiquitin-protein ligase
MPKLPADLLQKRLRTEVDLCKRELAKYAFDVSDPTFCSFPVTIRVTMRGVPGPVWKDGRVTSASTHRFTMKITDEYPYHKPIVIWETPIFHPNIMTPEDGGFVCTKLLDEWSFNANLLLFIQGLETLLSNPNSDNAYISDSQALLRPPLAAPGDNQGEERPQEAPGGRLAPPAGKVRPGVSTFRPASN